MAIPSMLVGRLSHHPTWVHWLTPPTSLVCGAAAVLPGNVVLLAVDVRPLAWRGSCAATCVLETPVRLCVGGQCLNWEGARWCVGVLSLGRCRVCGPHHTA